MGRYRFLFVHLLTFDVLPILIKQNIGDRLTEGQADFFNNSMKKALPYIFIFLAGALIAYLLTPKASAMYEQILKDKDREHEVVIKKLERTIDSLLLRDVRWTQDYKILMDNLVEQRKKTNTAVNEYIKIKKSLAPHYSDHSLDSLVCALTN